MELTTTERPVAPSNAGLEKAAILLLTLGTEAARDILGHLAHGEIQALSQAMARVRSSRMRPPRPCTKRPGDGSRRRRVVTWMGSRSFDA